MANYDVGVSVNGFNGGTSFTNVLANDLLNGVSVVPTDVITTFVSSTNGGISLSGTNVIVAPGTPAGNYELIYRICQVCNLANCDTGLVRVTVNSATIVANDDSYGPTNGYTGSTNVGNALSNDLLNGSSTSLSGIHRRYRPFSSPAKPENTSRWF